MKISKEKRDKVSEQILAFLFQKNPQPQFTSYVAQDIARDEEFTKKLLFSLKGKELVIEIKRNASGLEYLRRSRWKLSPKAYEFYARKQK
jgi:hypothetical protein